MRSTGARMGLLVVLIAVAVGLFVVLSGDDDDNGGDSTTTSTQPTTGGEPAPPPKPEVTTITVKDAKPVGGVEEIEVSKGDRVEFKVVSVNVADDVHLHGYDLTDDLEPGGSIVFSFAADKDGVYEAELEGAHEQILELRVNP